MEGEDGAAAPRALTLALWSSCIAAKVLPGPPSSPQEPISAVAGIDELGFLPGWGNTVGRVRESFQLLLDIVQAPDADTLEKFLGRLPLMFKVCLAWVGMWAGAGCHMMVVKQTGLVSALPNSTGSVVPALLVGLAVGA